jgi:hypothetical protein
MKDKHGYYTGGYRNDVAGSPEHQRMEQVEDAIFKTIDIAIIISIIVGSIFTSAVVYIKYRTYEARYKASLEFIKQDLPTEQEDEIMATIIKQIEDNARLK